MFAQGFLKGGEALGSELNNEGDVGRKLFFKNTAVLLLHQQPYPF